MGGRGGANYGGGGGGGEKFPQLEGTEKQISYASDLRKKYIDNINEYLDIGKIPATIEINGEKVKTTEQLFAINYRNSKQKVFENNGIIMIKNSAGFGKNTKEGFILAPHLKGSAYFNKKTYIDALVGLKENIKKEKSASKIIDKFQYESQRNMSYVIGGLMVNTFNKDKADYNEKQKNRRKKFWGE